jgi:hypothetical protein
VNIILPFKFLILSCYITDFANLNPPSAAAFQPFGQLLVAPYSL